MKKVILGLLSIFTLMILTGCGKENIVLDLNSISSKLDNLQNNEIYLQGINPEDMDVYGEMDFIYDYDFQEKFSLDKDLLEQYRVYYGEKNKEILAVFKPIEGKKEEVKKQLNEFMNSINAKLEEIDNLLVYVASNNNDLVIQKVKESKSPVFGSMMEVKKEEIKDILNIESNDVEEFLMKTPAMMVQSNTYIIAKPSQGKEEVVKGAIDEYMTKLEEQWSMYLPAQYELVKNRKVEKIGDYLVYIVSSNNDLVFDTIKNEKVEK